MSGDERPRRRTAQREALSEVRALLEEQRAVKAELRKARREAVTAARRIRGRAPAMSVEQRRAAIIDVAVPLLLEHGANVTTSQIAAAAGIAEGTVFRAFKDKNELLMACMRAAMNTDNEIDLIAAIDRSLPLAEQLTQAVTHVGDFQTRMWTVLQALHASGLHPERTEIDDRDDTDDTDDTDHDGHRAGPPKFMVRVINAIEGLFEGAEDLRVEPATAARLLLGLAFSNRMQGDENAIADLGHLVDLFLHGILRTPDGSPTGGRETQ